MKGLYLVYVPLQNFGQHVVVPNALQLLGLVPLQHAKAGDGRIDVLEVRAGG